MDPSVQALDGSRFILKGSETHMMDESLSFFFRECLKKHTGQTGAPADSSSTEWIHRMSRDSPRSTAEIRGMDYVWSMHLNQLGSFIMKERA